jgi:hypothetical protein
VRFAHDGMTLWYGTPDAEAPAETVAVGTEVRLTIGVSPADASQRIVLVYRINQGETQVALARWVRNDNRSGARYFAASFPPLRADDRVEYGVVCRCAGRQVPDPTDTAALPCTFRALGIDRPAPPTDQPRIPVPPSISAGLASPAAAVPLVSRVTPSPLSWAVNAAIPHQTVTTVTVDGIIFNLTWRGRVVDKPPGYEDRWGMISYPSAMYDDEDCRYKMWFASWPHDFVYYAESDGPYNNFRWNPSEQAITPGPCDAEMPRNTVSPPPCSYRVTRYSPSDFGDPSIWPCAPTTESAPSKRDSFLTADPSVLKVDVGGGERRYYMWYTGTSEGGGHYNAIFFAESVDGKTWVKKYRQVRRPDGSIGLCAPFIEAQSTSGRDSRPDGLGRGYGAGQSSVIQLPDFFYHYYTDMTVPLEQSTVRLLRMTGPFSVESWPSRPVSGIGRADGFYSSWDVKYHVPTGRMIAFSAIYPNNLLLISVSKPLRSSDEAAYNFATPVQIPMADLGVPGSGANNGGLLGNTTGYITGSDTAFYFGYGNHPWTIGALEVHLSDANQALEMETCRRT